MNIKQGIALGIGGLVAGMLWLMPSGLHTQTHEMLRGHQFAFSFDIWFGQRERCLAVTLVMTLGALLVLRTRRSKPLPLFSGSSRPDSVWPPPITAGQEHKSPWDAL